MKTISTKQVCKCFIWYEWPILKQFMGRSGPRSGSSAIFSCLDRPSMIKAQKLWHLFKGEVPSLHTNQNQTTKADASQLTTGKFCCVTFEPTTLLPYLLHLVTGTYLLKLTNSLNFCCMESILDCVLYYSAMMMINLTGVLRRKNKWMKYILRPHTYVNLMDFPSFFTMFMCGIQWLANHVKELHVYLNNN